MPTPPLSKELMQEALNAWAACGFNESAAAAKLGLPRGTFQNRRRQAQRAGLKPRIRLTAGVMEQIVKPEPTPSASLVRVVQIPDAHDSPKLPDKSRFRWIGQFIADRQPDYVVDIGDSMDCESLCFHVADATLTGKLKPSFLADLSSYDEAMDALWSPVAKVSGYEPVRKKCRGNHENRIWRIEDQAPHAAGMYQLEYENILARYGIEEHGYGEFVDVAGVDFVHVPLTKMCKPRGGENVANTLANKVLRDTVIGHTHVAQQRCAAKDGQDRRARVFETGTALPWGYIEHYVGHAQSAWWWGINEFWIRDGRIEGWNAIPMFELERMYG